MLKFFSAILLICATAAYLNHPVFMNGQFVPMAWPVPFPNMNPFNSSFFNNISNLNNLNRINNINAMNRQNFMNNVNSINNGTFFNNINSINNGNFGNFSSSSSSTNGNGNSVSMSTINGVTTVTVNGVTTVYTPNDTNLTNLRTQLQNLANNPDNAAICALINGNAGVNFTALASNGYWSDLNIGTTTSASISGSPCQFYDKATNQAVTVAQVLQKLNASVQQGSNISINRNGNGYNNSISVISNGNGGSTTSSYSSSYGM